MFDDIELSAPFLLEASHLETPFATSIEREDVCVQPDKDAERVEGPFHESRHDSTHDAFAPILLAQPEMME